MEWKYVKPGVVFEKFRTAEQRVARAMREAKQAGAAPPPVDFSGVHVEPSLDDENLDACPHCGAPVGADGHYANDDTGLDDDTTFDEIGGDADAVFDDDAALDDDAEMAARESAGWTARSVRRLREQQRRRLSARPII